MNSTFNELKYFINYSLLIISNFLVIIATPQDKLIFLRFNSYSNIIFGIFIYIIYLKFRKINLDKFILLTLFVSYLLYSFFFSNQYFYLYFFYPLIILWSEFFCSKFNLLKERLFIRIIFLGLSLSSFLYFDESFLVRFFFIIFIMAYLVYIKKNTDNYEAKSLNLIKYTIINLSCYYVPLVLITYLNNDMKIIYILYSGLIAIVLRLADIAVRNSLNNEKGNIEKIIKYSSIFISICIVIIGIYFKNFYFTLLVFIPYLILYNLKNIKSS